MPYCVSDVFDTAAANQPASLITGEAVGKRDLFATLGKRGTDIASRGASAPL